MLEKLPPLPIVVRPCFEQDLQWVQFIYAHHVLHGVASFELEPPDLAETRARWAKAVGAGLPFLVACPQTDPTRVVGFAYAAPFHQRPAYAHTFEDSVYVAPGAAGRGVGAILLNGVLHELQHPEEVRQVLALIGDSDNAASIALHSKLLFQRVGKLHKVGYKFGRDLDVIIMQRNIGPRENR
ncbi:MAG TPA: GNAT family N-acetyltransferase [Caulobacterales bacterium]|jgi:phosphinothricin acetyltransferase|nr:GNAT family N-acetyltransferase [Caulobacterales bacterium]